MSVGGIWSAIVNLSLFAWAINSHRGDEEAQTMTFVSLVLIQFFKAYNFRSDRHSVLNQPFANKWLNLAIVWELLLLVLIVYVPFLHEPFGTFSLPLVDWMIIIATVAHDFAGAGAGQVDGASRLVRRPAVDCQRCVGTPQDVSGQIHGICIARCPTIDRHPQPTSNST